MSNRYKILEEIGQGGLGAIFKAYDTQLGREVAIKRVLPASNKGEALANTNLLAEAKTLSTLKHPNIVTIHDVAEDEQGPFIVMELLEGETLDDIIERGSLGTKDFEALASQTLEGLVAAQARGFLHRDLKPANIMLVWLPSGKFQAKILDFGLASFSEKPMVQTVDYSDSIFGSIYFMAPEQFERLPIDSRTDLYSLGTIFYFALTGRYAFWGETPSVVMAMHLNHKFTPLAELRPDLSKSTCAWVEGLFARNMDDRPADAQKALDAWMIGPVIDESQLRDVTSGDLEVAGEVFHDFLDETEPLRKQLRMKLESGHGLEATKLARDIRGTAATLGYTEIISITSEIEKNALKNPADCLIVNEGFAPALTRLKEAMSKLDWGKRTLESEEKA